jgi:hypothetical protein
MGIRGELLYSAKLLKTYAHGEGPLHPNVYAKKVRGSHQFPSKALPPQKRGGYGKLLSLYMSSFIIF